MDVLDAKWSDIQGVVEGREGDEPFLDAILKRLVATAPAKNSPGAP
jgi:hypothetical protein